MLKKFHDWTRQTPALIAKLLGIPAVQANKCGPWPHRKGISSFPGLSAIIDSDGTVKEQMQNEEGVIISAVALDPSQKTAGLIILRGWRFDRPLIRNMLHIFEALGRRSYDRNIKRKEKALEMFSGHEGK